MPTLYNPIDVFCVTHGPPAGKPVMTIDELPSNMQRDRAEPSIAQSQLDFPLIPGAQRAEYCFSTPLT